MHYIRVALVAAFCGSLGASAAGHEPGDVVFIKEPTRLRLDDGTSRTLAQGAMVDLIEARGDCFRVRVAELYLVPESPESGEQRPVCRYAETEGIMPASSGVTREEAIEHFTSKLADSPNDSTILWARCHAYGVRDFQKAVADCEAAMAADPANPFILFSHAALMLVARRHRDALPELNKAIELHSRFAPAFVYRAKTLQELGRFEDALADCNAAIALQPTTSIAYWLRGRCYFHNGDFELAIRDYTKALSLGPTNAHDSTLAHYQRASSYAHLRRWAESIDDYSAAIEDETRVLTKNASSLQEPILDKSCLFSERGNVRRMAGMDGAMEDCRRAIELDPRNYWAHVIRGGLFRSQGETKQEYADFDKAIEIAPFELDARVVRGTAKLLDGELDDALADFNKVVEMGNAKGDVENARKALAKRAEVWRQKGKLEAALEDLTAAIELTPKVIRADLYLQRAKIRKQLGDEEGAAADLESAFEIRVRAKSE